MNKTVITRILSAVFTFWLGVSAAENQPPKVTDNLVNLDAKPQAFAFDPAKTAVIVVDMQNDFGAKGGMLDRAGLDISGIQKAVAPTARVLGAARGAGIRIIYLKMAFKPDLSDLGASDSLNRVQHLRVGVGEKVIAPDGKESRILIRDTWNTGILADLQPEARDDVIYKTRFSGFYETDLDTRLKIAGIKYLIVTGCTTSVCVDSTVRDAMFRDYRCVVLADCVSDPSGKRWPAGNDEAAMRSFEGLLGWVSDSGRLLTALRP
jgi:ureidoacrylate peracid hydrolase